MVVKTFIFVQIKRTHILAVLPNYSNHFDVTRHVLIDFSKYNCQ